jgi:hypothetical protein
VTYSQQQQKKHNVSNVMKAVCICNHERFKESETQMHAPRGQTSMSE